MAIETQLKQYIRRTHGTAKAFCEKIDMPQPTLSSILQRGIDNTTFPKVAAICQGLNISIDALAHGEIVRFDEDGQPLPVLPPHDQALLDAYHAMSSQEQQMVCRMVGIEHPDEKQKKNKQHA